jgi:Fic family protein
MRPPYEVTSRILSLVSSVSEKLGEVNSHFLSRPSPQLRKQNRIKTIHSSLQIEGNTLTEDQITALIENKRVIGPEKDIQEVLNAIQVYDCLAQWKADSEKSFLESHKLLMKGLVEKPGQYRTQGVGIVKGSKVTHVAPPARNVPGLMKDLFRYLRSDEEIPLIRSCVFHYELEFIHPFSDGNGRMGRLWQTVILKEKYPVFEHLPFETWISQSQEQYYKALALSDKSGNSTIFIEYMLGVIDLALASLLSFNGFSMTDVDRLEYFIRLGKKAFTRKDYMNVFKTISSATASRDLRKGVELNLLQSTGKQNSTKYLIV